MQFDSIFVSIFDNISNTYVSFLGLSQAGWPEEQFIFSVF